MRSERRTASMAHNPFITPRKPPKKRKDREYKDGRKYLADKTELRRIVFERSGGHCEAIKNTPAYSMRCYADITRDTFHLAHDKHGRGFRNDDPAHCTAKCAECHMEGDHGSKCNYPRRAGKIMNAKKAQEYWRGKVCFCSSADQEMTKPPETSFCQDCLAKLPAALRHDIENTEGGDYLKTLAACVTAIMEFNIKA